MNGRGAVLVWIERGLIAIGAALAVWCAIVIIEAQYYSRLPVPPAKEPAATATLPGDAPALSRPRPAPAAGTWVARIEAPSVGLSSTVLEGSDDTTLARAAGHIEDTAFPGDSGNIGIAGHRDTIFRPVRNLHVGDPLVLTTSDRVFRYRIARTTIVEPEDVYVLDPSDHPTLTLVTCFPFEFIGHAPRRFIVSADLVGTQVR